MAFRQSTKEKDMNEKDRAQEVAEKITALSLSLFDIALQSAHIIASLRVIQENVRDVADGVTDVVKELPPEVQARLKLIRAGDLATPLKGDDGVVDLIRKMLKGSR